ncbi:MAG: nucleotidyltransferase domain-containing protein [Myxococcales bacterium]|nr:nucleotidyltransferase domain-containing protein [Myxococcales bacterium]
MDLRIRNLEQLDARAVTLPHGTEVVTRVDRVLGLRRVPQGSVGRVTKVEGDLVEVTIVGVGVARYARGELSARRVGQVRFAHRRADAWEALSACVVLDAVVGSHAWGLSDASSDVDRRGVFALPFQWTQGLVAPPEDLVSADGRVRVRRIYGTFGRYALGQLRRLEQDLRLAEHRAVILEWLRAEPALSLDDVAERLARVATRDAPSEEDAVLRAKQYVKQLYRSLADQGLLATNDFAALATFARDKAADFELPRELRPKNAYNLIRLLATATRWLRDGTPTFEAEGALRDRLVAIKRGEVALAEVLADAEAMAPELERARDASRLPRRPDVVRADALLRRIGEELARRWVERVAGPLGAGAAPAPEVAWTE